MAAGCYHAEHKGCQAVHGLKISKMRPPDQHYRGNALAQGYVHAFFLSKALLGCVSQAVLLPSPFTLPAGGLGLQRDIAAVCNR